MGISLTINMIIPGMPFDGDTLKERSLGGSETAGLCMARELVKRGHEVIVMSNLPHGEKKIDGVDYLDINRAQEIIQKAPHDVLIVERTPQFFGYTTAGKINVLWNHDLAVKALAGMHQAAMWNIDWIFLLSQFHIDQVKSVYPFTKGSHIRKTRNGIDLEDFPKVSDKIKGTVMYCARPERGLINLVKPGGIMERIYQADPSIKLYVAGYDNTTPEMANFYYYLWGRCDELPNVERIGHLTKKELYKHYAEAELYLYPTDFEEISCITAMECMACGTPFVTTRKGALPETLGDKTSVILDGVASTEEYQERFIGEVLDLLNDDKKRKKMAYRCRQRAKKFSWSGVAEDWEKMFIERFEQATADRKKLFRHFLYRDDVMIGKNLAEREGFEEELKGVENDYKWIFDPEEYKDHYEKFDEEQYEGITIEMIKAAHIDNFMKGGALGLRWPQVSNWFIEQEGSKWTVLDYGCGIGHFTCGLSGIVKKVVGMDLSEKTIGIGRELVKSLDLENVSFCTDDKENIKYDVIFLGDVLEHIPDPVSFVRSLEERLADDGKFLITTPFGPSRFAAGKHAGHRNHIHEYEYQDLKDLFGNKKDFYIELIYWQHTQFGKELLGWYMTSFGKKGKYGEIDLDRKFMIQVPRDELSVCMIVRNEEDVLRKCLKSVEEIADEIIIVDTGSMDRSMDIAKEFGAMIIEGSDPLREGFETPRNESIKDAKGDWILWIDADEELQGIDKIRKYLRNSVYDGFRIKQHHFSCQPSEATVIDKPVRLFRRRNNIRFYGLVHEHPETALNQGVGEVIELSDVDLAHGGYYTEDQRRKKFWRNVELMMRDIKKYPNRVLGKWLYMRDLMHIVLWSMEQRGSLEEDAVMKCVEVVQLYRNNFLDHGGHMMVDGLQYYSKALSLLNKGIDFIWNISVGSRNGKGEMVARFESRDEFLKFMEKVIDEKSYPFTGPYAR